MPEPLPYFEQSLFAAHPFRFQMRFRKASIRDFYSPSNDRAKLLSERRKWNDAAPERTTLLLPEGNDLLQRAVSEIFESPPSSLANDLQGLDLLKSLSISVEPDFLLLQHGVQPQSSRIVGGAVCFPSSWALEEKLGQSMEFTHGPVPNLNAELGEQISRFLQKNPPGISWERTNWGLSRSPELNQHPSRKLPRLNEDITPADVFMRVEWQSLAALPPNGVIFGIRVYVYPFSEVMNRIQWKEGLKREIETMPAEMLKYKGLLACREKLLNFLR
ncbi:MAG: heme-dependent oxidative N-demethylase subunit alpha family protein [Verrucomicrobiales bacterium]